MAYSDVRKLLENKDIDAIVVTTPNHWHALITIWACQAGKDVYVQKPASYSIWEGRQMVAAARKYNRIVQSPNGSRGQNGGREALEFVAQGKIGKVTTIRGLRFGPHEHWQSDPATDYPRDDRLRSLVGTGPDPAARTTELALRLALAVAVWQW